MTVSLPTEEARGEKVVGCVGGISWQNKSMGKVQMQRTNVDLRSTSILLISEKS